jgi:hypothetical protein
MSLSNLRWLTRQLCSATAITCLASIATAAPIQWPAGSGGNDHYYERVEATGLTYDQADALAAGSSYLGLPGHLLILETADYAAEFNFVNTNVYSPGVDANRTYWVGAKLLAGDPDWKWVDGTTVPGAIVGSWNIDHFEGPGDEGASFFQPASNTLWDYITTNTSGYVSGYVVEYQPVPEPATACLAIAALGVCLIGSRVARRA